MKFVEESKAPEGVPVEQIKPGDGFQWDKFFWLQCSDTRDAEKRVTRTEYDDQDLCVGINLETGILQWIPASVIVIPVDIRFRILGRADKQQGLTP
jgi:YD repeat-containing protein